MKTEKKTFTPAEVEVIRFEKNDVIATSGGNGNNTMTIIVSGEPVEGDPFADDGIG